MKTLKKEMELLKPDETWKLCTTKTSNVWKHFLVNQNDKTKLKCVHCGYQIIWTNNSTTTLRVHLLSKSKHHSGKIIDLDKRWFSVGICKYKPCYRSHDLL